MNPHFRLAQQNLKLMNSGRFVHGTQYRCCGKLQVMVTDKDLRFGDRVLWEDRLYSSKSSQSAHEPPNDTYWTEIEMWTVWRDYIKPHLIWQSAANFAPYAEVRTAQEGIRRVITDYNEPLSRRNKPPIRIICKPTQTSTFGL